MTDNVIPLGCETRLNIDARRVREEAEKACSGGVICVGWDEDGELYTASSIADGGHALLLLRMAERMPIDAMME